MAFSLMVAMALAYPQRSSFALRETRSYERAGSSAFEKEHMTGDGLEAIFMASRPVLLRFLAARGGGIEAEDLLQELWMKVRAAGSGPIAEPRAYIFRMAENLMLDRRRAEMRRSRRDDQWTDVTRGTVEDISDVPSIERTLIARDQLRRVDAELDALGERTAAIFRSYRIDGLSQKDIAAAIGISVSAIEKHLQKAYRALVEIRGQASVDSATPRRPDDEGTTA